MASTYKRKKGWWIVPLLAVVFIYTAFTYHSQSKDLYLIQLELAQLEKRIQKEEAQKQSLIQQKDEMTSDDNIEKIAREKLGMVKDGERVFVDTNQ